MRRVQPKPRISIDPEPRSHATRARSFHRRTAALPAAAALPLVLLGALFPGPARAEDSGTRAIQVFHDNVIHFTPDDPGRYDDPGIRSAEDGRVLIRSLDVRPPEGPYRILARVESRPIPADSAGVTDRWDRAGDVRLAVPGAPDVEIVKFVTAYGGPTVHEVDVTDLAPLLRGPCTFKGFVDTWASPGWRMDFTLRFVPDPGARTPVWVQPVLYEESVTAESMAGGPISVPVEVPPGLGRVTLRYLVSGHCTDGVDADEFVSKTNAISVDGADVYRFNPWRDDCRRFRGVNPYTHHWPDGTWSSDYSRSGWCPGDVVSPVTVVLGRPLTAGEHVIGFRVEDVRPANDHHDFGYWRVSAVVEGWPTRP